MKTINQTIKLKALFLNLIQGLAIITFISAITGLQAQRTLPATDQFDYVTGPLQTVGLDWTRISGSGNDLVVADGNVSFNGYLGAVGRMATMTNGAVDDLKLNFTGQNNAGTIIYTSFALNVLNITGLSSSGTYCFILGSGTNNFAARIFIKVSGTGYALGISKTSTAPASWSSAIAVSTNHLLVLGYEIQSGTGNDIASLWIDPPITTIPPTADFSASAGTDFGGGSSVDGFMLRQATGSPNASIDDIVISTAWIELLKDPFYYSSGFISEGNFNSLNITGNTSSVNMNGNISLSGNLVIASGSKLIINPSKTLTVQGNTNLNSTESIIIKSSAMGIGSFIDNGVIHGPGTAIVERYLTGYTSVNDVKFHFISSPVTLQPIQPGFVTDPPNAGDDFYKWDEPLATWINAKNNSGSWNTGFESTFEPAKGYLVSYPADLTKVFTGSPNTNPPGFPMVKTCTWNDPASGGGGGWNLLGNPYPSAIDWNLVQRGSGIDNALYYYDASVENYRYYIQYQPGFALGNGTQYIPAMQGFMVHASETGDHTISIDNSSRIHQSLDLYYKNSLSMKNVLKLRVEKNSRSDELFILFKDEASPEFDGSFDAYKLFSLNPEVPQIYSITPGMKELSVNALKGNLESMVIPVGIKPGTNGVFTLTAEGTDNFAKGTIITLEDLQAGTTRNLMTNPPYIFTASPEDDPDRFRLHFSGINRIEGQTQHPFVRIYAGNHTFYILPDQDFQNGMVSLYTISGKEILQREIAGSGLVSIQADVNPGLYLVKVNAYGNVQVEKVIIR